MSNPSPETPPLHVAPEAPEQPPRRSALALIAGAGSVLLGAALGIPLVGTLLHPLRRRTVGFDVARSRLGPVSRFAVGEPRKVAIAADRRDAWSTTRDVTVGSVWVVRKTEEPATFAVFSATCPHLGCPVGRGPDGFLCPCHQSRFALDGIRAGGAPANPAPRDMDALDHEVVDGVLWCRYQRFRPGRPDAVPAEEA